MCFPLVNEKIICLKFFYRAGWFVLDKICWMDLIFFSFAIDNVCCWANFLGFVYFVLDFRAINFFINFKMRKMLGL